MNNKLNAKYLFYFQENVT